MLQGSIPVNSTERRTKKTAPPHGIWKAVGNLLVLEKCTQYEIMAIHGHTEAKTSEIYTKGVERWKFVAGAMKRLEGMEI